MDLAESMTRTESLSNHQRNSVPTYYPIVGYGKSAGNFEGKFGGVSRILTQVESYVKGKRKLGRKWSGSDSNRLDPCTFISKEITIFSSLSH